MTDKLNGPAASDGSESTKTPLVEQGAKPAGSQPLRIDGSTVGAIAIGPGARADGTVTHVINYGPSRRQIIDLVRDILDQQSDTRHSVTRVDGDSHALAGAKPSTGIAKISSPVRKPLRVFLSFPKDDLVREASKLKSTIARCEGAFDVDDDIGRIDSKDVLVLVLGHKYDTVQAQAFRAARGKNSSVLVYVLNPHIHCCDDNFTFSGFAEQVFAQGASLYDDVDDLLVQVLTDLGLQQRARHGGTQQSHRPKRWLSGFCLASTVVSAERGKISILALIESLSATIMFVWIAFEFQTVAHIALGCVVAPLFVLRSKRSVEWSMNMDFAQGGSRGQPAIA